MSQGGVSSPAVVEAFDVLKDCRSYHLPVDPLAQCLGANAQIAGYLRNGMFLVGSLNQLDGFLLELRRIPSACLAHLRPLSRNLIA